MSGKGFGKCRVQQGAECSELPSLFSESGGMMEKAFPSLTLCLSSCCLLATVCASFAPLA